MSDIIDPVEMAREMNDAISPIGGSDLSDFFYSVFTGAMDTAKNYGYLVYDYLDTDSRFQKDNDKYRLLEMIRNGLDDSKFNDALSIVYDFYFRSLTKKQQELLYRREIAKVIGSAGTNSFLYGAVKNSIASTFAARLSVGLTVSFFHSTGGLVARSVYSSRRLIIDSPDLYWKMRAAGDLDLLYFLIEKKQTHLLK